jgi:hypothetical protein
LVDSVSASPIDDLASQELLDWFIWDNLAMAAYRRAGGDCAAARNLLARAMSKLDILDDGAVIAKGGVRRASTMPESRQLS